MAKATLALSAADVVRALPAFFERANEFYWRLTEILPEAQQPELAADLSAGAGEYRQRLVQLVRASLALPEFARTLSDSWPQAIREVVPGAGVGVPLERTWAPLIAYLLVHALPGTLEPQALFDGMDLRAGLADSFAEVGFSAQDAWRAAAKLRLLVAGRVSPESLHTEGYWADGDVRWLTGANESNGDLYLNRESFDQLLCWLQLPELLAIAGRLGGDDGYESPAAELAATESTVRAECERMAAAGYRLKAYIGEETEAEPEHVEGAALV